MNMFHLAGLLACSLMARAGGEPPLPEKIAPPSRIPHDVADSIQPVGAPVTTASMPREVRRAVIADAARRFEVDENAVVLSQAEQVTWSDGSLGCPRPGMSYTQALVPGFRVSATTPAGKLLYHTDMRGQVVSCVQPAPRRPAAPGGARPGTQPRESSPDR